MTPMKGHTQGVCDWTAESDEFPASCFNPVGPKELYCSANCKRWAERKLNKLWVIEPMTPELTAYLVEYCRDTGGHCPQLIVFLRLCSS